jgi:hypothetical protein
MSAVSASKHTKINLSIPPVKRRTSVTAIFAADFWKSINARADGRERDGRSSF